jgi:hypothetical protein
MITIHSNGSNPGDSPGLDAIYIDLDGAHNATEVLSAISSQTALRGSTITEIEMYLNKLLKYLRDGSVLIFDNVGSAQTAAVLTQLVDPFNKTLSIIVITSSVARAGDAHSEENALGVVSWLSHVARMYRCLHADVLRMYL